MMNLIESLENRRLMAFGDLDLNLNGTGWAALADPASPAGSAMMADGRFYVASQEKIIRYRANGTLDPTFGKRGRAYSNFSRPTWNIVPGVMVLANGTIQTFGYYWRDQTQHFWVQRITADGQPDETFGTRGTMQIDPGLANLVDREDGYFYSFATVATEIASFTYQMKITISRYDSDFVLDTSFGTHGIKTIDIPKPANATGRQFYSMQVLEREDGSYTVVAKESWSGTRYNDRLFVMQLTNDFELDTSAFTGGFYTPYLATNRTTPSPRVQAVAVGKSLHIIAYYDRRFDYVRLTDKSGPGILTLDRPLGQVGVNNMFALPDGRVILEYYGQIAQLVEEDAEVAPASWITLQPPRFGGRLRGSEGIDEELEDRMNVSQMLIRPDGQLVGIGTGIMSRASAGKIGESRPDDIPGGAQSALTSDNAGRIHLVYRDAKSNVLLFKRRDETGRWDQPEVIDTGVDTGLYLSLANDSRGRAVVAYYHGPTSSLRLATRIKPGKWNIITIDDSGSVGQFVNLAIGNQDGLIRLAYHSKSAGSLKLAVQKEDGTFYIQTLDNTGQTGRDIAMHFETISQRLWVAYTNASGEVKLGQQINGGKWQFSTVARTSGGADGVALGYDGYFTPGIRGKYLYTPLVAYRDVKLQDLVIAKLDPERQTYSSIWIETPGQDDGYSPLYFSALGPDVFYHSNRTTGRITASNHERRLNGKYNDATRYPMGGTPISATTSYGFSYDAIVGFVKDGVLRLREFSPTY